MTRRDLRRESVLGHVKRWLIVAVLIAACPQQVAAAEPAVWVLHVNGEINSVAAGYVASGLARAGQSRAGAAVIVVDTPGGIGSAMDDIVGSIVGAPVPVAVYVAPTGSRAASAGLFVAQAADVVAMAPGTNIGSAHPVTGSGGDIAGDLGRKVLNDAVARVRNLASLHGRNADWCEQAVRDSVNIGADEAVRLHVADLEPATMANLLTALDGRSAPRPSRSDLTFHTAGATTMDDPMSAVQQGLQILFDANVAYLLLLIAVFGLIAEVSTPGAIVPGVVGGVSAILALVALSTLPINVAGAALIAFSFLLFVVDIKAPTHGVLTVGGLISLLLGSAFLLDTRAVDLGIDWRLILAMSVAITAAFAFIVRKAVRARSRQTRAQGDALVGSLGEARGPLAPEGRVFVAGAIWPAVATRGPIASGKTIRVVAQEPAGLRVEAAAQEEPQAVSDRGM